LRNASVIASSDPCESALTTRFSVATSPRCTAANTSFRAGAARKHHRVAHAGRLRRWARARRRCVPTLSFGRDAHFVTGHGGRRRGRAPRPERRCGLGHGLARFVEHGTGCGPRRAATIVSPTRNVPSSTSHRHKPDRGPWSRCASSTAATAASRVGDEARRPLDVGHVQDLLEEVVDTLDGRPETSTRSCCRPTSGTSSFAVSAGEHARIGVPRFDFGDCHQIGTSPRVRG